MFKRYVLLIPMVLFESQLTSFCKVDVFLVVSYNSLFTLHFLRVLNVLPESKHSWSVCCAEFLSEGCGSARFVPI